MLNMTCVMMGPMMLGQHFLEDDEEAACTSVREASTNS